MEQRLRLLGIQFVSFRYSDITNWDKFRASPRFQGLPKGGRECYLLVSYRGDQLMFVMGELMIEGRRALDTRRLRLEGRPWSMARISEYAEAVGLKLIGVGGLKEAIEQRKNDVREHAKARALVQESSASANGIRHIHRSSSQRDSRVHTNNEIHAF